MLVKDILLVNESDEIMNVESKMEVHKQGSLHRAFSILIFNDKAQMLLQKRAKVKYHSGGLWSNTCCGHPFMEKEISEYAQQRLFEELGMNCSLKFVFKFKYEAILDNNLIENEIVHVFVGHTNCLVLK